MGSVVLKLLLTTWNFWLLFLLPSWVWLLPSQDMVIMVTDMAMVMDMDMDMGTMDTMARGLLRLSLDMAMVTMDIMARDLLMLSLLLPPSPDMDMVMDMAMDILATDMVDMDTMDIMARGLLMLSPAMDIMVMDMVMDMAMDMDTATMDIMERDQLMLSQDMDIMAMDMVMDTMDMDMAMDMDITVRQEPECCYFLEFSKTEVDQNRSSQDKHTF